MDGRALLHSRLGSLGEAELAVLLERRADVLAGVAPRGLAELAERLWHPHSLATALRELPLPYLQLAEAAQALGAGCTRTALAGLLDGTGPAHRAAVDRVADDLVSCAVLAADGPERLVVPDSMAQIFPSPLRLDPPMAVLLGDRSVDAMRRIGSALGIRRRGNRAETVADLLDHFADPARIRALVAGAPPDVAAYLVELAAGGDDDEFSGHDPHRYRLRQAARSWALERGVLIGEAWGWDVRMPAEVALALRGPDYRARFSPDAPAVPVRPAGRDRIEQDSAAAAMAFGDHLLAVLDHVARAPLPALKTGGVGTRELTRLARATRCEDVPVRLVLELADAMSLLRADGQVVAVTAAFRTWRELEPAARYAATLEAWWRLDATPTVARDEDGKAVRALARAGGCGGCRAARVTLLDTLAGLDGAAGRGDVARAALWRRPLAHVVAQDDTEPLATVWREGELLGVIAHGALSPLGQALRAGELGQLLARAAELLPASADHASFGSDLTAYVVGAPSAQVSALLDSCADREGRGAATTWRFAPASIRRALDEGTSGADLTEALAAIATGELPQPLTYLIGDVARRHGHLRLRPAATCITSEDVALLAQVAAERRFARFGLRLLAPTVLAADAPLASVLDALRAAGYLPVAEGADGGDGPRPALRPVAERARPPAAAPTRAAAKAAAPQPRRTDPAAAAAALVRAAGAAGGGAPDGGPATATEQALLRLSDTLSGSEIRQLAHAIDTGTRVCIDYISASGGATRRVVDRPELLGPSLYAWCELREDERVFTVSRIRSVTAV